MGAGIERGGRLVKADAGVVPKAEHRKIQPAQRGDRFIIFRALFRMREIQVFLARVGFGKQMGEQSFPHGEGAAAGLALKFTDGEETRRRKTDAAVLCDTANLVPNGKLLVQRAERDDRILLFFNAGKNVRRSGADAFGKDTVFKAFPLPFEYCFGLWKYYCPG